MSEINLLEKTLGLNYFAVAIKNISLQYMKENKYILSLFQQ